LQQFVQRLQPDEEQLIRRVLQGRGDEDED